MRKASQAYSVELVEDGQGELVCNRRRYTLVPGDIFILHAGERHEYRATQAVWRKQYICFWPRDERTAMIMRTLGLSDVSHIRLSDKLYTKCRAIFERLQQCARSVAPGYRQQLSLLTHELLMLLSSSLYDTGDVPRVHPCVASAIACIRSSVNQRVSVEAVARECGCSSTHLNRLFKQYLGMTTHEWLENYRLLSAATLLRKSGKRLHQIADEVGYSDPYYFSTAFKRVAGMSPSEYRRVSRLDRMPGAAR